MQLIEWWRLDHGFREKLYGEGKVHRTRWKQHGKYTYDKVTHAWKAQMCKNGTLSKKLLRDRFGDDYLGALSQRMQIFANFKTSLEQEGV